MIITTPEHSDGFSVVDLLIAVAISMIMLTMAIVSFKINSSDAVVSTLCTYIKNNQINRMAGYSQYPDSYEIYIFQDAIFIESSPNSVFNPSTLSGADYVLSGIAVSLKLTDSNGNIVSIPPQRYVVLSFKRGFGTPNYYSDLNDPLQGIHLTIRNNKYKITISPVGAVQWQKE
ncbi:MAG: hypothetical protein QXP36_00245 [Conexivisphaerales archaeon]